MPVYEYGGQHFDLPDGLSNEQALSKIKSHLGETEKKPSVLDQSVGQVQQALDKNEEQRTGAAEAALSLGTGALGMVAGLPVAAIQKARTALAGGSTPFEKEYADAIQRMTYEPRTEAGQEALGRVGEFINKNVIPVAPMAGLAMPKASEGVAGMRARFAPKDVPPASEIPAPIKTGVAALKEELNAPEPQPVARQPQMSPMQSMAKDLAGVEPFKTAEEFAPGPMSQMAEQLPDFEMQSRGRAADEVAARRQAEMELEVKRQTSLDMGAAERSRREQAPTGYKEWQEAQDQASQQKRLERDSELAQRAGSGEQLDVFAPHTNMHRAYEEMFAKDENGVRPLSPREFKETLDNLAKEPGTAFQMPEDVSAAYKDYLNRTKQGQGDLFGAHEVLQSTSHKNWGDLTPAERGKATKALNKIGPISENMVERMKALAENKDTGITQLRAGFTKEDVTKAWEKVGMAFNEVKTAMSSVDIHNKELYYDVSKDIRDYMESGLSHILHFAGQELKAANYPKNVIDAFKKMTKAASEYEQVKTASEMPFELRQKYNLMRQVTETYQRLKQESNNIATQIGPKSYKEMTRAEKKLAQESSEKDMSLNFDLLNTPLSQATLEAGMDGMPLHDIKYYAERFDKEAEEVAKAFLNKWNTPFSKNNVTYLRAGFTKEDLGKPYEALKGSPLAVIPGVGDRLRDVGNAMIESPTQAIDLAVKASDISQNAVQRASNYLTKGGTYLKAKVNNPVVHYAVDSFLKADSLAKAEVTAKVHDTYLRALRELSKTERTEAFELLNLADLNQKQLTSELMQKHGVSKKLQDFVKVHQIMMEDVLGKINEAREATGKKPITGREAYSAMSMSGDFRKVVYKMVDGEQQVVGVIGADSKSLGKSSLSSLEEKVLEKDPTLSFGPLQDMTKTSRSARGTPHEAFLDVLDTLGENNPHIAEFVQTLKDVAKDDPANYMGMHKHTMQKKGVFGMEGRKFWESPEKNAEAFFENQVKYAESAYNWSHLANAAKDVNEVIRHPDVVVKQDNAVRLSEEYMQNALGINSSRMGKAVTDFTNAAFGTVGLGPSVAGSVTGGARALANTWMLSLSPAFLGMQIIQAPTVMPAMTAFLRGRGAAPASTLLTQGLGHFAQAGMTLVKEALGKDLSPTEQGALAYAKKHHVYATDMVEHANQISKGVGYYTTKVTQTPAAVVEQATRAQVYLALVHMMNEMGITPKNGLYEQSHRFTDMAMVNYSSIEKPKIYNSLGPIGSLAYNLKSFSHNELSRWSMYAREIPKTGNAVPLLTQMATTIVLAGVMGLPFFSQFEDLYDVITKKLGKPRSLVLDVQEMSKAVGKNLGEHGAFALSNGAPSLLGVDLSARLGLGDVLPSSAADAAFAGGGKLYEMGKATGRAVLSPSEENLKSAAINLAPPVAQGPLDVAWYQKNGLAYSKDPTNLRPMARRTDADVLFKKIGLTGIHESAQKQQVYQQAQLDKAYTEYRTAAMRTIAQDLFRNRPIDPATIDKYFKTGQGDPQTFQRDLERLAIDQNMSPQESMLLKQTATQRIPQLQSLVRRTQ